MDLWTKPIFQIPASKTNLQTSEKKIFKSFGWLDLWVLDTLIVLVHLGFVVENCRRVDEVKRVVGSWLFCWRERKRGREATVLCSCREQLQPFDITYFKRMGHICWMPTYTLGALLSMVHLRKSHIWKVELFYPSCLEPGIRLTICGLVRLIRTA